jgi:hypothetical protein
MRNRDRFIILFIALTVVYFMAAYVDRCDGGCTTAEEVRNGGR